MDDLVLGINKNGEKICLSAQNRLYGTLVVGHAGSGKTHGIMKPMLKQDIENKNIGVTVFDLEKDLTPLVYVTAKSKRRNMIYFSPLNYNVYFNPFKGREDSVIHSFITVFKFSNKELSQYCSDLSEELIKNTIKVLKRVKEEKFSLSDVVDFLHNFGGQGKKILEDFEMKDIMNERSETFIIYKFFMEYFEEKELYKNTLNVRTFFRSLAYNDDLSYLFLPKEDCVELDFKKHIKDKDVVIINFDYSTFTEVGEMFLNLLFIRYSSAVLEEENSNLNSLYVDNLMKLYPVYTDLLKRGRKQNIIVNFSVQTILENDYLKVLPNIRNIIILPFLNSYELEFWEKYLADKSLSDYMINKKLGEFIYNLSDNDSILGCKRGIGTYIPLTEEELQFIEKRMKRYNKQLSKGV